jgi:hypothetical protein
MARSSPTFPAVATGLAAVLLASCGDAAGDEDTAPDRTSSDESPATPAEPEPFTVAFGGDVHFEGELLQRLDADPDTAIGDIAQVFGESDISMVNLETAVTEDGTPVDKEFTFRAPADAYQALAAGNVDVATLANNHGMDYGLDGLHDTLDHAEEAGFPIVGLGRDAEEAYAPHIMEANGNTVALFGATDVLDVEYVPTWTAAEDQPGMASVKDQALERMEAEVGTAAEEVDAVLVYLHWGLEGEHCPLPHAPDLARRLIEAGADAVVGAHAHVLGPGGYQGDAYVHYGLGNFAFYNYSGPTAETGVLRLTMLGGEILDDEWLPGRIEGGVPVLLDGPEAETAHQAWESHRDRCDLGLSAEAQ